MNLIRKSNILCVQCYIIKLKIKKKTRIFSTGNLRYVKILNMKTNNCVRLYFVHLLKYNIILFALKFVCRFPKSV